MNVRSARDGPSTVLVGVDGSRTSLRALAYAGGLARRQATRLVAVHVTVPAGGALGGLSAEVTGLMAATSVELAEHLREEVRACADRAGYVAELIVLRGDPFTELAGAADRLEADLLVVGVSESAGHRLLGSLAVRLVRAGRWPVTVVP